MEAAAMASMASKEGGLVGLGRFVEAADLTHELKRGGANFVRGDGRVEVEEHFDVAAHGRQAPWEREWQTDSTLTETASFRQAASSQCSMSARELAGLNDLSAPCAEKSHADRDPDHFAVSGNERLHQRRALRSGSPIWAPANFDRCISAFWRTEGESCICARLRLERAVESGREDETEDSDGQQPGDSRHRVIDSGGDAGLAGRNRFHHRRRQRGDTDRHADAQNHHGREEGGPVRASDPRP